jgi:hypothetical protein
LVGAQIFEKDPFDIELWLELTSRYDTDCEANVTIRTTPRNAIDVAPAEQQSVVVSRGLRSGCYGQPRRHIH